MIELLKKRKPEDPADSGALNDISFILIIFFIVIAGFTINKGFLMNLPDTEKPRLVKTEDLLVCNLDASGILFIDETRVTPGELRRETEALLKTQPNLTFLLQIHPDAEYQSVITVIHEIRTIDVENFSFKMASL